MSTTELHTDASPADKGSSTPRADGARPTPAPKPRSGRGKKRRPKRRRRSPLRILWTLLIQILIVVLVLLTYVLGTQSGLRQSIALVQELVPGMLEVEEANGRIAGDLELRGLAVHLPPTLDLSVGAANLNWRPFSLLGGTLRINRLAVADMDLHQGPAVEEEADEDEEEADSEGALPEVSIPINIELGELLVERVRVYPDQAEEPSVDLRRALASAAIGGSRVELRRLEVELDAPVIAQAGAEGYLDLAGAYPVQLALTWGLALEPAIALDGKARVVGEVQKELTVEHKLEGTATADMRVQLRDLLEAPSWDGVIELFAVRLQNVQPDLPQVDLSANLSTGGDLQRATVIGKLTGALAEERSDLPEFERMVLDLDLLWENQVLTINGIELQEAASNAQFIAKGRLDTSAEPLAFEVDGAWERLRWPLMGESLIEAPSGKLDVSGDLDAFSYSLGAEVFGANVPETKLNLAGKGSIADTAIETLHVETLGGIIDGGGTASWAERPSWNLSLVLKDIDPGVQLAGMDGQVNMDLASSGGLEDFSFDATGTAEVQGIPPIKLLLKGHGDTEQARIERLRLDTLGGTIVGDGQAGWTPQPSWDAKLQIRDLDPGSQWPEWPGKFGADVESRGEIGEQGPNLFARISNGGGSLRGYPVGIDAKVAMRHGELDLERTFARLGDNQVEAEGQVGETMDLRFDLHAPQLDQILPGLRGLVRAKGTVGGKPVEPVVKLELTAEGVDYGGQGVERLGGEVDVGAYPGGPFRIDLDGTGLVAGGMIFETLSAQGQGDMSRHELNVDVRGEVLSLALSGGGSLADDGGYSGQLGTLVLETLKFGTWRLRRPAPIAFAPPKITAGPLCIADGVASSACVEFAQTGEGMWDAKVGIDQIAFDLLGPVLPQNLIAEGGLQGKLDLSAADGILNGTGRLGIPKGVIRLGVGEGSEALDFSGAKIDLKAGRGGIDAGVVLPLAGIGDVNGKVALPGFRLSPAAGPEQALRGRFTTRVSDLGRIEKLLPEVTDLSGAIDVDLGIAGTLGKPAITGQARIDGFGFAMPVIGLSVKDVNLAVRSQGGTRLTLDGRGNVGGGNLELRGRAAQGAEGWNAEFSAKGEELKVADTKEFEVYAIPDIQGGFGPGGGAVRGSLTIPKARIRPRTIPSGTVSPSADVVMEGTEQKDALPMHIDLRVVLGDEVTVDAFGLQGTLQGELQVLQEPGRDMVGNGQLGIVDGSYSISTLSGVQAKLGKPLSIDQGRVMFAKSPLDNPGLFLLAKREGGDVTAGVRVIGSLKEPKLTFFSDSDPGLTQAEITSYIVTGMPPKRDAENENDSMSVGTYVAPKLFMEYENSLGDEANKIRLRYDLTKSIELQTETGDTQGADIFYKFER